MKSLPVMNLEGQPSGELVELPSALFEETPSEAALYYTLKAHLAHQRQGNACTKNRSAVEGSTAKLFRQKGTGRARVGSVRSPIRRGGGTVFGPEPRVYDEKVPKKVKRLAFRSALSQKAKEDQVRLIEAPAMETPSTGTVARMLRSLGLEGRKVLFVMQDVPSAVLKSCRNIPRLSVKSAGNVSTFDVINCDVFACTAGALSTLTETRG